MFLILLAGIQSLPVEPFEAAKVDGAGAWRTFVDHTLPMLRPTILVAVTLRVDRRADDVRPGLRAHPAAAREPSTQLISIYGYQTFFQFQQFGYAAAMLIMVALVVIVGGGLRRRADAEAADDAAPAWRRIGVRRRRRWPPSRSPSSRCSGWSSTSLKSNREITQDGTLVPHSFTFANYASLFNGREFGSYLTNSIVVTAVSVAIALLLGTHAAYALARFRLWRGHGALRRASACW